MSLPAFVLALSTSLFSPFAVESSPVAARGPGCEARARALFQAARARADARYWERLAWAVNGAAEIRPDELRADAMHVALRERAQALSVAERQLRARMADCGRLGDDPYAPLVVPEDFTSTVDHPYSPLVPGRTLVYERATRSGLNRVEVTTLRETTRVDGVDCRTVETVKRIDGELEETSTNWYAQHADGSVWWFGEWNQHYEEGHVVRLDGSWRAGVDGAQPGIRIPGDLNRTSPFRRGLANGASEDVGRVRCLDARALVPFGQWGHCLEIEEWDPLELLEWIVEIYVPGLGLAVELDTVTGERLELVDVVDAPVAETRVR